MPVQSSPVQSSPVQSVIIPTYNRKNMLKDAIESVLKQEDVDLELIIADNCSTDGTEDFVKSFTDKRIVYFRNPKNIGYERNQNAGLRKSRGKYITFLDDDDYYTDYRFFAKALKIFEEHDTESEPLSFVAANAYVLNVFTGEKTPSNIGTPGRVKGVDFILKPQYRKPLSTFPTVFKAEALRRAGHYDLMLFDTATYLEAALEGDAWFIPDLIGMYRTGHTSLTLNHSKTNPEAEEVYYSAQKENARRTRMVRDKLYHRADKKEVDRWYISSEVGHSGFYAIARPALSDRIRTAKYILGEAGFMPKLWVKIVLPILREQVIKQMKKITPLRKLYRFFKYRLMGKPYPEF